MKKTLLCILGALALASCGGRESVQPQDTSPGANTVVPRSYTQKEKETFLLQDMDVNDSGKRYMNLYWKDIDASHGSAEFVYLNYAGNSKYNLEYKNLMFTEGGKGGLLVNLTSASFSLGSESILFTGSAYAYACTRAYSTAKNDLLLLQSFDLTLDAVIVNATILDSSRVSAVLTYTASDRSLEIGQSSIVLAFIALNKALERYESMKDVFDYPDLVA